MVDSIRGIFVERGVIMMADRGRSVNVMFMIKAWFWSNFGFKLCHGFVTVCRQIPVFSAFKTF